MTRLWALLGYVCGVWLLAVTLTGCWKSPDYPDSASVKKGNSPTPRAQPEAARGKDEPSAETGQPSKEENTHPESKDRGAEALSAEEIYQQVKPSLVLITARVTEGRQLGSGFLAGPGTLVTNRHVVAGASQIRVEPLGRQDQSPVSARKSVMHPSADLAILDSELPGDGIALGNFESVQVGESVYVAGNPEGLEATFSKGIVSAIRSEGHTSVLQITAPVSEGSSGGPVLNEEGKVIGVVYAVKPEGQNLNFAVPVSYVREALGMAEKR